MGGELGGCSYSSKYNGDVRVGGELGEVLIGPSIDSLVYTMV